MAYHLISRDALGALTKLGQGGQGIVYQAPKVKVKFADQMVFKEYKPNTRQDVNFDALSAMPTLVEESLPSSDGQQLVSIAAWPCAIVENTSGPAGFVMPAIPAAFYIDLTTVKGRSKTLSEFQHLLNPPSVLTARGITISDEQKYQLLREAAKALSFFHRIGVCVGDISPKNVLFTLKPNPAVYFVDCDTMRVNGVSALPQVETPGWEVPADEELATTYSDTHKLGLLALRLLVGDQGTRNPQDLPATTPKSLRQLITDTLTKQPTERPAPETWTYLLGHVLEDAQHRATGPAAAPQGPTPQTYTPEPTPLVRSRPPITGRATQPVTKQAKNQSTTVLGPTPSATALMLTSKQKMYLGAAILLPLLVLIFVVTIALGANQSGNEPSSSSASSTNLSVTSSNTTTSPAGSSSTPSERLVDRTIRNASVGECFRRTLGPEDPEGNSEIIDLSPNGCGNSGSEIRVVGRQVFYSGPPPQCDNYSDGRMWSNADTPRVLICFVYDSP